MIFIYHKRGGREGGISILFLKLGLNPKKKKKGRIRKFLVLCKMQAVVFCSVGFQI